MTSAPRRGKSCSICGREGDGNLCKYHEEACRRLTKHYEAWKQRTGLAWNDYLAEISKNELAGRWVREAAEYLLEHEEAKAQRGPSA
jgi:DNA topoisomerase-1